MNFLYSLADSMVALIIVAAVVQVLLCVYISQSVKNRSRQFLDSLRNVVKGIPGAPDHDSSRTLQDEVETLLRYVDHERANSGERLAMLESNLARQAERGLGTNTFRIESLASIAGALVQAFPLLGILGTILAIAKSAAESSAGGTLDASAVTTSFTLAMDTTILGILFGIIFSVVDSIYRTRVEKFVWDAERYQALIETRVNRGKVAPA